jgi:hypothetical protein
MKIGSSIFLIAVGAILSFAVADNLQGVDLTMIGYILMGAGVLALILSLLMNRPRPINRSSESRTLHDPGTGETITRNETRGDTL